MTPSNSHHSSRGISRRTSGLSLVEVMISTLLVGTMLAGATSMLRSTVAGRAETADVELALHLARALVDEIMQQPYEEPVASPIFGRESGELSNDRSQYDDVDDYDNWSSSPPESHDNVAYTDLSAFTRTADVELVDDTNPNSVVGSDDGVKRITVTVEKDGVELVKLQAWNTNHGFPPR